MQRSLTVLYKIGDSVKAKATSNKNWTEGLIIEVDTASSISKVLTLIEDEEKQIWVPNELFEKLQSYSIH